MDGDVIPVFGNGLIIRDFLYVEDLVECLLMVAKCDKAYGEVFNVASGIPINFIDLAKTILKVAGTGHIEHRDFTKERKVIEPGDYCADISKIKKIVGWVPRTTLEKGLRKTIDFYRKYKKYYWE